MSERAVLPDFELPSTGNQRFRLSAFAGHPFVLYFYPKDDIPGCTDEGVFRDLTKRPRLRALHIWGTGHIEV